MLIWSFFPGDRSLVRVGILPFSPLARLKMKEAEASTNCAVQRGCKWSAWRGERPGQPMQRTKVQHQTLGGKDLRTPRGGTMGAGGCEFPGSGASAWTAFCFLLVGNLQHKAGSWWGSGMNNDEWHGRLGHAGMGTHGRRGYLRLGESGKVSIASVLSPGDWGGFWLVDGGGLGDLLAVWTVLYVGNWIGRNRVTCSLIDKLWIPWFLEIFSHIILTCQVCPWEIIQNYNLNVLYLSEHLN